MQIDPIARTVRLSVRELAVFRNVPLSEGAGSSPWRAAVGQQWHKTSEEKTRAETPDARFEVPLNATWRHRDWTFLIQGRMDQVLTQGDATLIREVKTVRTPLPAASGDLAARYPEYFAQAAIYLGLARVLPEYADTELSAELLFINIDDGMLQSVRLEPDDAELLERQMDAWIPFLEDRRDCRLRLESIELKPAFETLREGQAELFAALDKAALQSKTVLLEAPTGFGKTGIVLEHALRQMQSGLYERCIYLTSKSTGQVETIRQLQHLTGDHLRYVQMRNRSEHRIDSPAHTCTGDDRCNENLGQCWAEAAIHPPDLFEDGTLTLERAKSIGAETGVCPYALTKSALPYAEIWIGDTNYVFSPSSQAVFLEQHGFDPAKTLLIVDEAHNLPDRAADALSVEIAAAEFLFALEELRNAGAPRRLLAVGNELSRHIDAQPGEEPLTPNAHYEMLDLCEDFAGQLKEAHFDYEALPPFALDYIFRIPDLVHRLAEPAHQWLYWTPTAGVFRATCLDASGWIHTCLHPFGGSILMSATLSPLPAFRESCGLSSENSMAAPGHAPWREGAYTVAIDCRVDTRMRHRDRHYATTARTIAQLIAGSPGVPIAVFFSSYLYAENVHTYLEAMEPGIRALVQPRGVELAVQEAFIDEGLFIADALFLILGSSYAEGIDKLGGRIETVMIVGPALPEVNAVQEAKMAAHADFSRNVAFREVCIIPAMRRIHQALGRIVRAPEHRAKVVLHCKRYADPDYFNLLAPEYQDATVIRKDADFLQWLTVVRD